MSQLLRETVGTTVLRFKRLGQPFYVYLNGWDNRSTFKPVCLSPEECNLENSQLVIGVDAGGTKTQAWLARVLNIQQAEGVSTSIASQVQVMGYGSAGSGNPRAVGFDAATENMWMAIVAAYASAKCPVVPAAAICMGVAGAGRAEEQKQLEQWCRTAELARRVRVTGDALPVLAAAYADRPLGELALMSGIALICGTGSMAWGCIPANDRALTSGSVPASSVPTSAREARAGGWGYLLGDEGSGYWLAMQGLRAACRSVDGRGPATRLLPALLDRLKLTDPTQLIGAIYGEPFDRRRIAALAEVVVALAEDNSQPLDGQVLQIIEQAAVELCQLVLAVDGQLSFGAAPLTLAATGGVLLGSPVLRQRLQQQLFAHGRDADVVLVENPVQGAVYLAASLAK